MDKLWDEGKATKRPRDSVTANAVTWSRVGRSNSGFIHALAPTVVPKLGLQPGRFNGEQDA